MDRKIEFQRGRIIFRLILYIALLIVLSLAIVEKKDAIVKSRNADIISVFSQWEKEGVPVNALIMDKSRLDLFARTTAARLSPDELETFCTLDLKNRLREGQVITASNGKTSVQGIVASISPSRNVSNGLFPVRFRLEKPLKENGEKIHVEIITASLSGLLKLPIESILQDDKGSYVYKISDEKAQKTRIREGASNGFYTAILSGLAAGDKVITEGLTNISEGIKVNVRSCGNCK